jgi:hypothetical protein
MKRGPKPIKLQKGSLVRLAEQGVPIPEQLEMFGVSYGVFNRERKRLGVGYIIGSKSPIRKLPKKTIQAAIDAGKTRAEFAKELGVSLHILYARMVEVGLQFPRGRGREAATVKKVVRTLKARKAGKTFREIGESLGVTKQRAHQLYNIGIGAEE